MTLNQWARLKDIARARREFLGLTWSEVEQRGGVTDQTLANWSRRAGRPSPRMRQSLNRMDDALEWRSGTSWGLVAQDRDEWTPECLEDESLGLIEADSDDPNVGVMTGVLRKLREMDDDSAKQMRAKLVRMFDLG